MTIFDDTVAFYSNFLPQVWQVMLNKINKVLLIVKDIWQWSNILQGLGRPQPSGW
jgi:hypothetical protein